MAKPLKNLSLIAFLIAIMFSGSAFAQLTGLKNIPGDYATLDAAITDLNAQGVGAGGVVLNLLSGNPETAPVGGYVIGGAGSLVLTSTSASSPVAITGNSNIITASGSLAAGTLNDGIFKLVGADYITISGFTMIENPANTTTAAATNNMTEWGVALLYASLTDGAKNNTITGNTITLGATYQNAFGIYSNVMHSPTAPTVAAGVVTADGSNSDNTYTLNTISGVNIGIALVGSTTTIAMDLGAVVNQNTISGYGINTTFSTFASVSQTVNGIYLNNNYNFTANQNSVTSSAGAVTTTGTIRGIYSHISGTVPTTGTYSRAISNNTISVRGGNIANILQGITTEGGSTVATVTFQIEINNNTFTNFGHTVSGTGAITMIQQAAAAVSNSINGNQFDNISVNTTGNFTFISNNVTRPANSVTSASNNAIVTAFSKTGSGGTVRFYDSFGTSGPTGTENSNANNFSNITLTGTTILDGWRNADGSTSTPFGPSKKVTGNTFSNITMGTGAITSIVNCSYANPGDTANVSGNTISNITSAGTVTIFTSAAGHQRFYNNTIHTVTTTGTTINVMTFTGGVTQSFFANKVYNITSNNAAGIVNGVNATTIPITLNIYNNFIGDLKAPLTSSTADAIRGISLTGTTATTTINISFNTIYLNATSAGANFNTSGIFHTFVTTATSASMVLRSNVIVNLSTPNGTGKTSALRRSAATNLNNYSTTSNNNLFYAGTPGANNVIYYDGTNFDQTLSAFKTRVTPREGSSVTENPVFTSTTGSDANFLNVDSTVASQVESGGIVVSGINSDFYGIARYPNSGYPNNLSFPAYAPDMGAREFGGIWADLTGPAISYSALGATGSTSNRTLQVTITDPSGVATGGNSPRLYYKKTTDGAYVFDAAPVVAGNSYTFTINNSLLGGGGVSGGDIIEYYVAAQDLVGNLSTSPAGGSGINPPGTTPPGAPNTYNIVGAPLSGTYTVGLALFNRASGLNLYTEERTRTVTREVAVSNDAPVQRTQTPESISINEPNVSTRTETVEEKYSVLMENGHEYRGSLYHELTSAQRTSGNFQTDMAGVYATITAAVADVNTRGVSGHTELSLTDATYPTETYPITFNVNNEAMPSSSATITLKPAIGVTTVISGSMASNALIRVLSNYVIIDGSNTPAGTSKDMTITNISATSPSVVLVGSTGTTYISNVTVKNTILINGINTSTALVVSDGATLGGAGYFTAITLQNNSIQKAYMAIYSIGAPTSTSAVSVIGNDLTTSGANAIRFGGIYMQAVNGGLISQNIIRNFDGTTSEDDFGAWLATGTINTVIERNYVGTLKYTGTGGYGCHGFRISSGVSSSNVTVRNNQIVDLSGDGWVNTTLGDNTHGIYVFGTTTGVKLYNNSINLNGNTLNQTGAISYGITLGTGAAADIRNNNIVNNLGLLGATGLGSTCIFLQSGVSQLEASDNNNYYAAATGSGFKNVGYVVTTSYATVGAYATATGKDAHSVSGDPAYLNAFSGDVDPTNPNCWVINGAGVNGLVTNDYMGNPRPVTASGVCDIGAFEVIPSVAAPNATQTGTIGAGNTTTYSIFGRTFASITWGAAGTYPGSLTAVFNSGATPPNPPGSARYGYGYWSFTPDVQPSGGATYDITINFDDSQTGTIIDPATKLILAKYDGATWTEYPTGNAPLQSNLNYAAKTITVTGLSSFSDFALTDNDAPLPVELSSFTSNVNRNIVDLNWSTVSEINNQGFEIERKVVSSTSWSKIGYVEGNGTSNIAHNYKFTDRNISTEKYNYRLKQLDANGNFTYHNLANEVIIGVPSKFDISQNYPNPFNPTTKINYDLPFDSKVSIKLFDMTGREVANIVNAAQTAGYYTVQFNGANMASGIYFYNIVAEGGNNAKFVTTKKMVLVK